MQFPEMIATLGRQADGARRWLWAVVVGVVVVAGLVAGSQRPAMAQEPPFNRGIDRACSAEAQGFAPFDDLVAGTHRGAIGCVAYFGIALGREQAGVWTYSRHDAVTREQMASFIARTMNRVDGYRLGSGGTDRFPDSGGEHRRNINRLAAAGIVEGRADGTYGRRGEVTREQMASFVARAIEEITGSELPVSDVFSSGDIAGAHRENVGKLAAIGVVEGVGGGSYGARRAVSRQEMASFLARALDYLADSGFGSTPETPEFPQVVGSFTTSLVPGQARNHNIHLAVDIIDGQRIAPGDSYSLNQGIGPRTRARGFQENGFIDSDGDLISVVGGGVSQVATTFFNAAWFSGVELVSHRPHSQYFSRYPPGREATIIWGTLDVIVRNDTMFPITIATSHTPSSVTISLVGTPWGEVDSWVDAPPGVSTGDAFSVSYGRKVTYPDGSSSSQRYSHTYTSP